MANEKPETKSDTKPEARSLEQKLEGATAALAAKSSELNAANQKIATLEAELKISKDSLARRDAEIASINSARQTSYRMDPRAPWIAMGKISIGGGASIKEGEVLTFDPKNPPPGFTGLREGVHYKRAVRYVESDPSASPSASAPESV